MNLKRILYTGIHHWKPHQCYLYSYLYSTKSIHESEYDINNLCNNFNLNNNEARYLIHRHPVIKKISEDRIKSLIDTVHGMGFNKDVLLIHPTLFGSLPITLKFRFQVLKECGIENVTPELISSYLKIMRQKSISDLKDEGLMEPFINVENKLASCLTQWPTSLTTLISEDINKSTLFSLRLKIIMRYLELVLDLTKEEFCRGLKTYPTLKHRPLEVINDTLKILQLEVMMPIEKIKNNIYLIHADAENLKQILYTFRAIGGIDIKEVLRMYPKLAMINYKTLLGIRNILKDYGISNEAQVRCFSIYTLGANTVRERLEKAKSIPEFNTFYNHPRFLKIIHYKTTAIKRLNKLYSNNKKCLSLNILSGSSMHYEIYEKAPGDRLGKGKDLLFCVSQCLGPKYKNSDIHKKLKRHPFWINIPLVQVRYVFDHLSAEFTTDDIYDNCPILLYPWNRVKETLNLLKANQKTENKILNENLDTNKLNKTQKLSLVLYILEQQHYFSGNGIWSEERSKSLDS